MWTMALKPDATHRKAATMRKKYFGEESAFEFVWNNCDHDGLWNGDAATPAAEFDVTEDEAHEMIGVLCDGRHVEKVFHGKYAIVKWRERDDPGATEAHG